MFKEATKSTTIIITAIGVVVISLVLVANLNQKERDRISEAEKARIEAWIERNNLNRYGDSEDRVYMGGTPLFNERTGERTDRYEYILRRHPDKPWLK